MKGRFFLLAVATMLAASVHAHEHSPPVSPTSIENSASNTGKYAIATATAATSLPAAISSRQTVNNYVTPAAENSAAVIGKHQKVAVLRHLPDVRFANLRYCINISLYSSHNSEEKEYNANSYRSRDYSMTGYSMKR